MVHFKYIILIFIFCSCQKNRNEKLIIEKSPKQNLGKNLTLKKSLKPIFYPLGKDLGKDYNCINFTVKDDNLFFLNGFGDRDLNYVYKLKFSNQKLDSVLIPFNSTTSYLHLHKSDSSIKLLQIKDTLKNQTVIKNYSLSDLLLKTTKPIITPYERVKYFDVDEYSNGVIFSHTYPFMFDLKNVKFHKNVVINSEGKEFFKKTENSIQINTETSKLIYESQKDLVSRIVIVKNTKGKYILIQSQSAYLSVSTLENGTVNLQETFKESCTKEFFFDKDFMYWNCDDFLMKYPLVF